MSNRNGAFRVARRMPAAQRPGGTIARRAFVGASVVTLAAPAVLAPRPTFAQAGPAAVAREDLGAGLTRFSGLGGNVVLFANNGGGVLIDSGAAEDGTALQAAVEAALGGRSPEALINTHWHPEHTGGNDRFGSQGVPILAHENTRLWMGTEYYVDWQDKTYAPRAPEALPVKTFYSHQPQPIGLSLGNTAIEYGHLREAHTDGDVYVFIPDRNVLIAGGAVSADAFPILDYATGGWIGGLEDATRKLLTITDAQTIIVPHSGSVQRRAHLEAQLEMVVTVRGRVEDLMRAGRSAAEMVAAGVTDEFEPYWGSNKERFVSNVYGGLWWQGRLDGSL